MVWQKSSMNTGSQLELGLTFGEEDFFKANAFIVKNQNYTQYLNRFFISFQTYIKAFGADCRSKKLDRERLIRFEDYVFVLLHYSTTSIKRD